MSPLTVVAGVLIAGWALLWWLLRRQARKHSDLVRKIDELESSSRR